MPDLSTIDADPALTAPVLADAGPETVEAFATAAYTLLAQLTAKGLIREQFAWLMTAQFRRVPIRAWALGGWSTVQIVGLAPAVGVLAVHVGDPAPFPAVHAIPLEAIEFPAALGGCQAAFFAAPSVAGRH